MELLNLESFKLDRCSIKFQHNHKQCPYYHYEKDKKRPGHFFSDDLCPYIEKNFPCPFGDQCLKAHNKVEQLYQKQNYKTKFCKYYPQSINQCSYGIFCSFAHNEEEIQISLLHKMDKDLDFYIFYYKTVSCPFNQIKHDKKQCPYAHNWQDFRRVPDIYDYSPEVCEYWKTDIFFDDYLEGCPNNIECRKCHGWKELYYHPFVYKIKPCPYNEKCTKTLLCPFYHEISDQRLFPDTILNGITKFVSIRRKKIGQNSQSLADFPCSLNNYDEEIKGLNINNEEKNLKLNELNLFTSTSSSSFNSAVLFNYDSVIAEKISKKIEPKKSSFNWFEIHEVKNVNNCNLLLDNQFGVLKTICNSKSKYENLISNL